MGAVVTAGAGARVRRGRSRLYAIGLGVAALSLVCAEAVVCSQAMAQSPFVRNRTGAPAAPTPVTGPALDAQAARALERQRSILLRNSQSLNSIRAAQEAARAKGLLGPNYAVDAAGAPLAANPDGSPRVVGEGVCVINCGGSDAGLVPRLDGWTGGGLRTNSGAIVRRPEDIGGFVNPDFNAVGADGRTTVTVKQEQSRAIFEWQRFDIGRGTTLTFDQAGNEGWLALNTVANSIAPSQILGRMRADGGALVLNSNGVIFGPNSQVNLRTLIASTNYLLGSFSPQTLAERNRAFLDTGLLADPAALGERGILSALDGQSTGATGVLVQRGARIETQAGGAVILNAGSQVVNEGTITSPEGVVSLVQGEFFRLIAPESGDIRGLLANSTDFVNAINRGLIEAERGAVVLYGTNQAVFDEGGQLIGGMIRSTTSIDRAGFISVLNTGPGSVLAITPDLDLDGNGNPRVLPIGTSDNFRPSRIVVADSAGEGALILTPNGEVTIGRNLGITAAEAQAFNVLGAANFITLQEAGDGSRTSIGGRLAEAFGPAAPFAYDTIADVSGLKDVLLPASRNVVTLGPLSANDLANTPAFREEGSFLNGARVTIDPSITGVRSDGIAWIGSPLIDAAGAVAGVGVTVNELMTPAGSVIIAGRRDQNFGFVDSGPIGQSVVSRDAVIDISGGWTRTQAGAVNTTKLLARVNGALQVIDISEADPLVYDLVGFADGFASVNDRFGVTQSFRAPIRPVNNSGRFVPADIQGRDAGILAITGGSFGSTLYGDAFTGLQQALNAAPGTRQGGTVIDVLGPDTEFDVIDRRPLQANAAQLPAGGLFAVSTGAPLETNNAEEAILTDVTFVAPTAFNPSVQNSAALQIAGTFLSEGSLNQISVLTTGAITVSGDGNGQASSANDVRLAVKPGGVVDLTAGRSLRVAGDIAAPGGEIRLRTANFNVDLLRTLLLKQFNNPVALGSFDAVIDGMLDAAGQFVNNARGELLQAAAFLNGGSVTIESAPRVAGDIGGVITDVSGSILINNGAVIDVSAGGAIDPDGAFDLSSRGGDLALLGSTEQPQDYYTRLVFLSPVAPTVIRTPERIAQRVAIDPAASIRSFGFTGGGAFRLNTPEFAFGDGVADVGSQLPLSFINAQGFSSYEITSYKTELGAGVPGFELSTLRATFLNDFGGFLELQTVRIDDRLTLRNTLFERFLDAATAGRLLELSTGAKVADVVGLVDPFDASRIENDSFYRAETPTNLAFGGTIELVVGRGGAIIGDAGAELQVSRLVNEGLIRLPGGALRQREVTISDNDGDGDGFPDRFNPFTGVVQDLSVGVTLRSTSVLDLAGVSLIDPVLAAQGVRQGRIFDGGRVFMQQGLGISSSRGFTPTDFLAVSRRFIAEPGSVLDISGAADVYDLPSAGRSGLRSGALAPAVVWSDAGSIEAIQFLFQGVSGGGLVVSGADIRAFGSDPRARGGSLTLGNAILSQNDVFGGDARDVVSVDLLKRSGFGNLLVLESLTTLGDVDFVTAGLRLESFATALNPILSNVSGARPFVFESNGNLDLASRFLRLEGGPINLLPNRAELTGGSSVTLRGDQIDVVGGVALGPSVARANLISAGDIRLIGLEGPTVSRPSGYLSAQGDLTLSASRVYATTGTDAVIAAQGAGSALTIARPDGAGAPETPYSAGSRLTLLGETIVQGGAVFSPQGRIVVGSSSDVLSSTAGNPLVVVATRAITFSPGSVTSVSGGGLSIPFGETADLFDYTFSPFRDATVNLATLSGGVLQKTVSVSGADVSIAPGAAIDVSGGGDAFAYEFVAGTGGTRDVLSRLNPDGNTGADGLLFPDGRQVYAIVPELSQAALAAFDPVYSADYAALYSGPEAGKRVFLEGGAGIARGWHTLLPARYAVLPGALRIVERTGVPGVPGSAPGRLQDGTIVMAGRFGALGSEESAFRTFDIQTADVFRQYSRIETTSAQSFFTARAERDAIPLSERPRLPNDAGVLDIAVAQALDVAGRLFTTAGAGGRGASAVISADNVIVGAAAEGASGVALGIDTLIALGAADLTVAATAREGDPASGFLTVNTAGATLSGDGLTLRGDRGVAVADGSVIDVTGALAFEAGDGGALSVGAADLSGASVRFGVGAGGALTIAEAAALTTAEAILSATDVRFGAGDPAFNGLVVTDRLAGLGRDRRLSLTASGAIQFTARDTPYLFGDLALSAAQVTGLGAGDVTIVADRVALSGAAAAPTTLADAFAGTLAIRSGGEITLGGGALSSRFETTLLTAPGGVFTLAEGSLATAGDLVVNAGVIADRRLDVGFDGPVQAQPRYAITAAGDVTIAAGGFAAVAPTPASGFPGSSLRIEGESLSVTGARLRATAGALELVARTGDITLAGAVAEAPGYEAVFGDVTRAAPPGRVRLEARGGNLIADAASLVSVGGGVGEAGLLEIVAPQATGLSRFDAAVDGRGRSGDGASLTADLGFDPGFAGLIRRLSAAGFTGDHDVRTTAGDIVLAAGDTLRAKSVSLTADGGLVRIAGAIDTTGITGGDISLYGKAGVTLETGSALIANAQGYGFDAATGRWLNDDSRVARAGDITLGTTYNDGLAADPETGIVFASSRADTGAIVIEAGARIEARALQAEDRVARGLTADRLVPILRNNQTFFEYAQSDRAGRLTVRAPVIGGVAPSAGYDLNVTVADAASSLTRTVSGGVSPTVAEIVLEGFRRWDLGVLASLTQTQRDAAGDPALLGTGVSFAGASDADIAAGRFEEANGVRFALDASSRRQVLIDPRGSYFDGERGADGQYLLSTLNGERRIAPQSAAGLPAFVQDFRLAGAVTGQFDAAVAAGARLRAVPGLDLAYDGDVTLTRSWNLAAGAVDIPAAQAAGLVGTFEYIQPAGGGGSGGTPLDIDGPLFPTGTAPTASFTQEGSTDLAQNLEFIADFEGIQAGTLIPRGTRIGTGTRFNPQPFAENLRLAEARVVRRLTDAQIAERISQIEFDRVIRVETGALLELPTRQAFERLADLGTNSGGASALPTAPQLFVRQGAEAALVSRFASLIYRVDTNLAGEAPALALNAGGALTINGSISDGFFSFSDRTGAYTDANKRNLTPSAIPYNPGNNTISPDFIAGDATCGPVANCSRDPIGGANVFPRLESGESVRSSSYRLSAGSVFNGAAHSRVSSISGENFTVTGSYLYDGFAGITGASPVIRSGAGSISIAASGGVDLRGSPEPLFVTALGRNVQISGASIYTTGVRVAPTQALIRQPFETGEIETARLTLDQFLLQTNITRDLFEGGGDITVDAGDFITGQQNILALINFTNRPDYFDPTPWRSSQEDNFKPFYNTINFAAPPQFTSGIGAMGGGNVRVSSNGVMSQLTAVSSTTGVTADLSIGDLPSRAFVTFGGGDVSVVSGGDIVGGNFQVGSGRGLFRSGRSFNEALGFVRAYFGLTNAEVLVQAAGALTAGKVYGAGGSQYQALPGAGIIPSPTGAAFYTERASIDFNAIGDIAYTLEAPIPAGGVDLAIFPAQTRFSSLEGGVSSGRQFGGIITAPSSRGALELFAKRDIRGNGSAIYMDDGDLGVVPGLFGFYGVSGRLFGLPRSIPGALRFAATPNQLGNANPVRLYAGRDIDSLILFASNTSDIEAGRDILDLAFFGQNLRSGDITSVRAGRDIAGRSGSVATFFSEGGVSQLVSRQVVASNLFVIGGPGGFVIEAGRDLGPFAQSGFQVPIATSTTNEVRLGEPIGGGILSVGNEINPFLPAQGASVSVRFGVGPGVNWEGFREAYLDPANQGALDDSLFVRVGAPGAETPDRSRFVYADNLINFVRQNAGAAFDMARAAAPSGETPYATAYRVFERLPPTRQEFFLQEVYFAELIATADPNGPSRGVFSRGYRAVETLFPARFGYTANSLDGGPAGATERIETGNLDLRLATILTARGGDIRILGPGGRVLGGSVIRTEAQVEGRYFGTDFVYGGFTPGRLELTRGIASFDGNNNPVAIPIPPGFEGVITRRGGSIYSFTDGDFLLNQSRAFTVSGGDVAIWSSNADVNAGQGPRTSFDVPPVALICDINGFCQQDVGAATSGAGIAAFPGSVDATLQRLLLSPREAASAAADPSDALNRFFAQGPLVAPGAFAAEVEDVLRPTPPGAERIADDLSPAEAAALARVFEANRSLDPTGDVFLIAPRGAVDAGAAGIRVAGDLAIAALIVRNAAQIQVTGASVGVPTVAVPDIGGLSDASNVAGQAQQTERPRAEAEPQPSIIIVEVLGYGGGDGPEAGGLGAGGLPPCPAGQIRGADGECRASAP